MINKKSIVDYTEGDIYNMNIKELSELIHSKLEIEEWYRLRCKEIHGKQFANVCRMLEKLVDKKSALEIAWDNQNTNIGMAKLARKFLEDVYNKKIEHSKFNWNRYTWLLNFITISIFGILNLIKERN